ncbi:NADPH-dependent FMN reductase [Aquimarina sp. MAR_2010_214]|uniref:NADPH-dependent FMN reductase n=1 Tax=Aquimarina sp. MAR_2010_214 TaxID=1250026 RepID=UPI000C70F36C|nr:NAD(P)H-dependent oxidoreductase [Aquimarina sp. MAR_2010_214]PKV50273.1 NADPH-dependent FMN reductase [Aquimarina sp. MAR_2010_214]
MKKILAFSGSNSPKSINQQLLIAAVNKVHKHNDVKLIQLSDYIVPIYSPIIEEKGIPKPIKELFQLFTEAEGFMIASPEHNGLPSSFFKNIIDWLSRIDQRFFGDKPVVLMSTSPGVTGGASHLQILEKLLPIWGGKISGIYSLGDFNNKFDISNSSILDPSENAKLDKNVKTLIQ